MRLFHTVIALAAVFALAATVVAADKAEKKAAKKGIQGVIGEIKKEANTNAGSITVKVGAKKKDAAAATETKTFKITETTKFEKAPAKQAGQKPPKGTPGTPATFADLKAGDRVGVFAKGDTAERVVIAGAKKAK